MMSSRNSKSTKPRASVRPITKLSPFAGRLLREWKRLGLPIADTTVVVAVSGGADSVAWLSAIDELVKAEKVGVRVVVAHLNHKLRGKASSEDARWVRSFAEKLGYSAKVKAVNVLSEARKDSDNLEQAARRARYEFLESTAKASKATVVVVAHTLDDQAETVLLNLLRGSGASGLSGIDAVRPISARSRTLLARPLMAWARRSYTESYCRDREIDFRL